MKTKHIWIWSLVFGTLMACMLYIAIFSKPSEPVPPVKTGGNEAVSGTEQADGAQDVVREIINPMLSVSEGKRAISLKVVLEQGVSGYIVPGSRVDIVAYETTKDNDKKKEYLAAVLVLQNVKVLASGKSADSEEEALRYETVTVEVAPEEGVMLSLAAKDENGFYFMLRHVKDEGVETNIKVQREVIKEENQ